MIKIPEDLKLHWAGEEVTIPTYIPNYNFTIIL